MLTVVAYVGSTRRLCRCECGTLKDLPLSQVGQDISCGCAKRAMEAAGGPRRTHGLTDTPEHKAWLAMIQRCTNPKNPDYDDYGGRGIWVYEFWRMSFECFLWSMGFRPSPKHTLGRMDNDGPYAPWNCRWETRTQQMRNTRLCRLVGCGDVVLNVSAWAEVVKVRPGTIIGRLNRGLSAEQALIPPIHVGYDEWERSQRLLLPRPRKTTSK